MKNRLAFFLHLLIISNISLIAVAQAQTKDDADVNKKMFFRYTNEQGTKVIGQTIPPRYVRGGYEIVTLNGNVLKVVPPSPSEADSARIAQERRDAKEQARYDLLLRRSYSGVSDIESAKVRNLQELRNNITILQANLISVRSQLKDQEGRAAGMERNGQKVSDDLAKNIDTLRIEEKDIIAQIKQRELEYTAAADKYEQDKKRFVEITAPKPQQ